MKHVVIGLLDPSQASQNLGDSIIADSVQLELSEMFPLSEIRFFPTQKPWSKKDWRASIGVDFFIFGGSNILAHNFPLNFQWNISPAALSRLRGNIHLMGVGRWQDGDFMPFSKYIWKQLLTGGIHSVRDSATKNNLTKLQITSTNTSCPTTWRLQETYKFFPLNKVVTTLTDYKKDPARDRLLVEFLEHKYGEVYLWPQGSGDESYARSLSNNLRVLDRSLDTFNRLFSRGGYDYFGTRLHAGIRALQYGARSIIIPVDNRARDMANDIGLITPSLFDETTFSRLSETRELKLDIPLSQVDSWKRELIEKHGQ